MPFSYKSCFCVLTNQDTKATLMQQCYTQLKLVSLQASITIVIRNEDLLYGDLYAVYF